VTGPRVRIAVALDIAVIVVFVAIGRRNHDEGSGFGEVLRIAAPFLIGLAAGWIAAGSAGLVKCASNPASRERWRSSS
jgi:hypothetical protein